MRDTPNRKAANGTHPVPRTPRSSKSNGTKADGSTSKANSVPAALAITSEKSKTNTLPATPRAKRKVTFVDKASPPLPSNTPAKRRKRSDAVLDGSTPLPGLLPVKPRAAARTKTQTRPQGSPGAPLRPPAVIIPREVKRSPDLSYFLPSPWWFDQPSMQLPLLRLAPAQHEEDDEDDADDADGIPASPSSSSTPYPSRESTPLTPSSPGSEVPRPITENNTYAWTPGPNMPNKVRNRHSVVHPA
ncbi:uncharacterized protein EHS24_002694 [Apiotrichum porosum]|uniref:Uncharacterized protein n=1 Tax=Apiotrichum porosum TaxID=105984 RepID=A0A427XH60_9TREE|nr:uncharacterized protein EHS24_002694 [Apiotrichum porosum]RSH78230.1 hypothetical protein EHS24_002694 [Apiotrichum porosum]